jgi:6-phosphofructokinase 1
MDVQNWINLGGSELGAIRHEINDEELKAIAQQIRQLDIRGIIAVGGLQTYQQIAKLVRARDAYEELRIPMICVPATIGNNLPATELTVGADTALNNIIDAVDKIKYPAGSAHRAFLVEVMGRESGYLALAASVASGAEMQLLNEDGIDLRILQKDIEQLRQGFASGKKLGIVIIAEDASPYYGTDFVRRIMEAESQGQFDVREAILGHLQRGGVPTAFDRSPGQPARCSCRTEVMVDIAGTG